LQLDPLFNHVGHPGFQESGTERFGDVVVGPQVQALQFGFQIGFSRQHHHGNVAGPIVGFDQPDKIGPAQAGQHQVGDDEIGHETLNHLPASLSVGCIGHPIPTTQHGSQERPEVFVVFHDQDHVRVIPAYRYTLLAVFVTTRLISGGQGHTIVEEKIDLLSKVTHTQFESNFKRGALSRFAAHIDDSAVQVDQFPGQRQTDTRAALGRLRTFVSRIEAFKDEGQL